MTLSKRLLFTVPLIVFAYCYLRYSLADEWCSGLIDIIIDGFFIIFFGISIFLAFRGVFRKRETNKRKPDAITLTVTLFTLSVLIIGRAFGEDFKGKIWIYAETGRQMNSKQNLTLRKNGTFRVELREIDFTCYFSGRYQRKGDTIILDQINVKKSNSLLATNYLIRDTLLKPIIDTNHSNINFNDFIIIENLNGPSPGDRVHLNH